MMNYVVVVVCINMLLQLIVNVCNIKNNNMS